MMPISFAAILGGSCTLIGTNTNLILDGWLIKNGYHDGFGIFEFTPIVLPIILICLVHFMFFYTLFNSNTQFCFEKRPGLEWEYKTYEGSENSVLIGKTISEAGLRGLNSIYLFEIKEEISI